VDVFRAFEETEQSKIFPNAAFGYWKITVERPLRLRIDLTDSARTRFRATCKDANEEPLADVVDRVAAALGAGPHLDFNAFLTSVEDDADRHSVKLTSKRQKLLQTALAVKDETATPVIKKVHKPGKAEPDPLHGRFPDGSESSPRTPQISFLSGVVEYESDLELRDTEQVPLQEDGGIEAFFCREVLPHVPDAWIDKAATKIGYEISFTRYFYKPQPLRTLEEIRADIEALQKETEGVLDEILMDVEGA
jgi:type I restriction enzyme M protein